jgi:serine/threonine protein kinase
MDETAQKPGSRGDTDALVGRTLAGKFRIEAYIGGGAMGAVYKARQTALDKYVAVKVLHGQYADDPTFMARFQREAKAATKVDHPNSMRVLDFGQEPDGLLYIAMEFLDGVDLYRVVRDQWPLSAARIVDLVSQALAAIAVAHDLGIVHRDLKPENIMILRSIDDEGHPCDLVKVCDFGIAKFTEARESKTLGGPKLTSQGLVVGTPEYMSPEQAKGEPLDARSDLYAMGVILYQLLTGRVPFEADTALAVVFKHVTEEPVPPRQVRPDADARLEAICLKAMRKRREDRHQSAREMRADLRASAASVDSLAHAPTQLPPSPQPRPSGSGDVPSFEHAATAAMGSVPPGVAASNPPGMAPFGPPPGTGPKLTPGPTVALTPAPPPPKAAGRAWVAVVAAILLVAGVAGAWVVHGSRGSDATAFQPPPPIAPPPPTNLSPLAIPNAPLAELAPLPSSGVAAPVKLAPSARVAAPPSATPARSLALEGNPAAAPAASTALAPLSPPPTTEPVVTHPPVPAAVPPAVPPATSAPATPAIATGPFDPARARVEYNVTSAGGGATTRAVHRALSRATGRWLQCYRTTLERRNQAIEDEAFVRLVVDEMGNVVSAAVTGLDAMPHMRPCISAASRVHVDGVDTGDAWADVHLVFRAP